MKQQATDEIPGERPPSDPFYDRQAKSVIISLQPLGSMNCLRPNGYSPTRAMMLTASGTPYRKKESSPASWAENPGTRQCNTTNDTTNGVTAAVRRSQGLARVTARYDRCPAAFFNQKKLT